MNTHKLDVAVKKICQDWKDGTTSQSDISDQFSRSYLAANDNAERQMMVRARK